MVGRPPGKPGRMSVEEESAAYLRSRGMVAVPADSAANSLPAPVVPAYVVTPEFVGEFTKTLLAGVEDWRVRQRFLRAKTLCGDDKLAKEFADSSAAPPGCIAGCGRSMEEIARKYPGICQWAPEFSLLLLLGNWVQKDLSVEKKLNQLEARMREQIVNSTTPPNRPAKAPASAPTQAPPVPAATKTNYDFDTKGA